MRFSIAIVKSILLLGVLECGVAGHQHHEQEYIRDPAEELERKWSFEVRLLSCFLISSAFAKVK
jgi:hypothetical protein